jgi:hypothetical protein
MHNSHYNPEIDSAGVSIFEYKNSPRSDSDKTPVEKTNKNEFELLGFSIKFRISKTMDNTTNKKLNSRKVKRTPTTKINEYYCQTTNNINISVDIDKTWKSAKDQSSDKKDSINTSNSVKSAYQNTYTKVASKIANKKHSVTSESGRKIAGKHISITLNSKEDGDAIDIKISHKKEKETKITSNSERKTH